MESFNRIVGKIYDCAANPQLWPATLDTIRDDFGAAYVLTKFARSDASISNTRPLDIVRFTAWAPDWLERLEPIMHKMVGYDTSMAMDIDDVWIYSNQAAPDTIHKSEFDAEWVRPQNLLDCMKFNFLKREGIYGIVSLASHRSRGTFSADDGAKATAIAPHIRRAMMINELVDRSHLALALYRKVLDSLSAPVFILSVGRRIAYCNGAAERVLEAGDILFANNGVLYTRRDNGTALAFNTATERATKGDLSLGIHGIGVPLLGRDGLRAAAYVLPIGGEDLRRDLGQGHAAVFVAGQLDQQPMLIEILRTVFDLTPTEARIASLVAKGDSPYAIAEALGLSINTVRSHLARCYSKTSTSTQISLAASINLLVPPAL